MPVAKRPRRLMRVAAAAVGCALLAATASAAAAPRAEEAERRSRQAHRPTGRVVMRFESSASPGVRSSALERAGVGRHQVSMRARDRAVVVPSAGEDAMAAAARLAAQPGVRYAAPEGSVGIAGALVPPDDTRYASQSAYLGARTANPHSIDLEPAWDRAFNGASHTLAPWRPGVTVAVIDTGVNASYLEGTGEYVPVWDYVEGDPIPDDDHSAGGGHSHGTRVASIIRAQTANRLHVASVLHSSRNQVLIYKILDGAGDGDTDDALDAIMDAADRGAKVINCSFGEPLFDVYGAEVPGLRSAYSDAVRYAAARGAIVVAAAGNKRSVSDPPPTWWAFAPAAIPEAVCVGAIDPGTGQLAPFSNYGPDMEVDLVAAGIGVWSVDKWGLSSTVSGTSFAAPLVSGSLAFLWSLASDLPSSTVLSFLTQSASNQPSRETTSGWGVPSVWKAYQAMIAGVPEQGPVGLTPALPAGRAVGLSWTPAAGKNVVYEFGEDGGPIYRTEATGAQLVLSDEGTRTVWVRSYATDRWSHQSTVTATVTVGHDGLGALAARRLAGATRYQTAVDVSRSQFPTGAPAIVIASGRDWPDALAAAPLAAAVGGPLLLTDRYSLTIDTRNEIWRLRPSRVLMVGGTSALDADVRSQLDSLSPTDTVVRLAGADRYETAARIAERLAVEKGGAIPGRRALVCSGQNYPDALSGAAAAAVAGQPVLLTRPLALPAATASALSSLGITSTIVLGGTRAVADVVFDGLPSPHRVHGPTRYDTSRAIVDWARTSGLLDPGELGVSRGDSYPDALAAGVRMAGVSGPVLLVPRQPNATTDSWLRAAGPAVRRVWVFGGTSAIPISTENNVRLRLRSP